jgi:osmotically-inducible protein OsmY
LWSVVVVASSITLSGCPAVVVGGAAGAAAVAADPRTSGTILEDQGIEFRIANAVQGDTDLANTANISVTSFNGVVLLTGEAPTAQLKERAYGFAKNDGKVRLVHNEIGIAPPLPFSARNYDTWLTTKAKTKLLGVEELNAAAIKVVTSDTTVYLLGLVKRRQAQVAAKTVSEIEGVSKVVKAFEYTD